MQSEADVQSTVTASLDLYRYRWTHFRPAINKRGHYQTALSGSPGWPDIAATNGKVFMVIEVKSEKGVLSAEQLIWRVMLENSGVEYWLIRPSSVDEFIRRLQEVK